MSDHASSPLTALAQELREIAYGVHLNNSPRAMQIEGVAHELLALSSTWVTREEHEQEETICDGCVRGFRTFRRGSNMETQRWHRDGDREFLCVGTFANWPPAEQRADFVTREMHVNAIRGVEGCFTKDEWEQASKELHADGNSSWLAVVSIAISTLRASLAQRTQELEESQHFLRVSSTLWSQLFMDTRAQLTSFTSTQAPTTEKQ